MNTLSKAALFTLVAAALAGCDCGSTPSGCRTRTDCAAGQVCTDGMCQAGTDTGTPLDVFTPGTDTNIGDAPIDRDTNFPPCESGMCPGDARCVMGRCLPWGMGESDPECVRVTSSGPVIPQTQCTFTTPPMGDPFPMAVAILHTPLVADLGIATVPDAPTRPSIIMVSNRSYREGVPRVCDAEGFLRVIDGATCVQQGTMPAADPPLNSPVTPAVGDINGDGRMEIVAAMQRGGLVAYTVMPNGTLTRLWTTTLADGTDDNEGSTRCQWGAVSLYDIDDDGLSESIFEGVIWDSRGRRVTTLPGHVHVSHGAPTPMGDFDGDGRIEAVEYNRRWEYDATTRTFTVEAMIPAGQGYAALADFGDFPGIAGDAPGMPEIVVGETGAARVGVYTLGGGIIQQFSPSPGNGGGPPTIADFDGDGVPEIGVAFGGAYEVFNISSSGGTITANRLWSQPSQDRSSARTGSSVFDFNADGNAEVVYGDECFVRIYDGRDGSVLFSQARFSSTWTENPIVADVDGDGSAELVVGMSGPCSPGYCPAVDPIFPGLRCEGASDCLSGRCTGGFCECAGAAECDTGYQCNGGRCLAAHEACVAELRVYRDGRDRWAGSRDVWNQHAYHVTNINDDGTIPRTSAMVDNWSAPGLNNFRQNVQGTATAPGPDLTIQRVDATCGVGSMTTEMAATICNRGGVFLDTGIQVVFDQIDSAGARTRLCDLRTTEPVAPGVCTTVRCTAPVPADGIFEATADERALISECREANNTARSMADCIL